ncbi:response regulator [Paenibacillus sp. 598K]|uniref:response regulator n=1 Tax=Paenibacillus sp. 598K TaxID=1117987 RepID=UPI0021AA279B|nr:response regulator [Paenibacillus sp. 598K]
MIIADDERIQREGIARHVDWEAYGMQVAGLAEDGLQALELMERSGIDLLITDIKMPKMNGLELAERARHVNPQVKILIISGYNDFEYARTAIELKAYAYLLKPIMMDQLEQELDQLHAAMLQERHMQQTFVSLQEQLQESQPLLAEKLFQHMLHGFLRDEETIRYRMAALSLPVPAHGYDLLLLQVDVPQDPPRSDARTELAYMQLYAQLARLPVIGCGQGQAFQSKQDEYVILLYASDSQPSSRVAEVIREVRETLQLPYRDRLTIGVANRRSRLDQMHEAYKEAEAAARQKFHLGRGKTIYYRDIETEQPVAANLDACYEQMIQAVEVGNSELAEQAVRAIFEEFVRMSADAKPFIRTFCYRTISSLILMLQDANEKKEAVFGEEHDLWKRMDACDTLPDFHAWLRETTLAVCQRLSAKRTRKNGAVIEKIVHLLETHYAEPITIDELAKRIHLTPNYISNLFKAHIGESIIDYLTRIRMKRAIQLLKDESVRIYEVAEQTGYNSTSYFSVVFKNMYGISPKEYRDQGSKPQNNGARADEQD